MLRRGCWAQAVGSGGAKAFEGLPYGVAMPMALRRPLQALARYMSSTRFARGFQYCQIMWRGLREQGRLQYAEKDCGVSIWSSPEVSLTWITVIGILRRRCRSCLALLQHSDMMAAAAVTALAPQKPNCTQSTS